MIPILVNWLVEGIWARFTRKPAAAPVPEPKIAERPPGKIIDTVANPIKYLDALKAAGVVTIIQYDSRLYPRKQISPETARAIAAKGLRLAIVYEDGINLASFTEAKGYADALYSRRMAEKRGQRAGSAVYFAVDLNPTPDQTRDYIVPYFKGVRRAFSEASALPQLRVGVYGSGYVCRTLRELHLAELLWLTNSRAFLQSKEFAAGLEYDLIQRLPIKGYVPGLEVDPDDYNPARHDIGDFVPFAT